MFSSNKPPVFGFVNINPAVFSFTNSLRSSMFTIPLTSVDTSTTLKPAIFAEAGLVPWAESGTIISVLLVKLFSSKYFLIINNPVNSPDAPAGGWNVALSIPVISIKNFSNS